MTDANDLGLAGHVFISYVREDADRVTALKKVLEAAGVPVWTDKSSLGPGEDWRIKIEEAITKRALVFLACFSSNSQNKPVTYQNEELNLAVEQMRLRAFDQAWLMPVRFDDCELPTFRIGPSRDLGSLNRTDLFGEEREENQAALIAATLRVLGAAGQVVRRSDDSEAPNASVASAAAPVPAEATASTLAHSVKTMLLDPTRQMAVEELLQDEAARLHDQLNSTTLFPTSSERLAGGDQLEAIRSLVEIYRLYESLVQPLAETMEVAAAWATADHEPLLASLVQTIASTVEHERSGQTVLLDLRSYPFWYLMYASGLGAFSRKNYGALRALMLNPTVRRDGTKYSAITLLGSHHPDPVPVAATVLALEDGGPVEDDAITTLLQRGGVRYTPISDHLHDALRPLFKRRLPNDEDYSDLFDQFEVFIAALTTDAKNLAKVGGRYLGQYSSGRFTWRHRWADGETPEGAMQAALADHTDNWWPIQAGFFGGSTDRADAALVELAEFAKQQRQRRF
jgi:hypothetical protein